MMNELECVSSGSDPEISLSWLDRPADELVEEPRPLEGERFGKYLLVGELGVGGMAEVFLAVNHGVEGFLKVVTLKRVLPRLTAAPRFTQMFAGEARLAAWSAIKVFHSFKHLDDAVDALTRFGDAMVIANQRYRWTPSAGRAMPARRADQPELKPMHVSNSKGLPETIELPPDIEHPGSVIQVGVPGLLIS
jgi:hypothetical protein